jgi:hypothetical protein
LRVFCGRSKIAAPEYYPFLLPSFSFSQRKAKTKKHLKNGTKCLLRCQISTVPLKILTHFRALTGARGAPFPARGWQAVLSRSHT